MCSHNCVEINGKLKRPMQDKREANTVRLLGTSSSSPIRFTALPALITEAISILNLKQLKKPGKCQAFGWGTTGCIQQAWLSGPIRWASSTFPPHRLLYPEYLQPYVSVLKTCCLTLKNKCIKSLCTFKSLPKAECLPCVLPTALVFASVTNRGGFGCCCMQVDLVWTKWANAGSMP